MIQAHLPFRLTEDFVVAPRVTERLHSPLFPASAFFRVLQPPRISSLGVGGWTPLSDSFCHYHRLRRSQLALPLLRLYPLFAFSHHVFLVF